MFISGSLSYSQTGGNNTFEFLNLPLSSRITATGGNLLGIKEDDLNMAMLNPSLLSSGMNKHLSLSYMNYVSDINYGHACYSAHIGKIGSFSAGMLYMNYGKFKEADITGEVTGSFGAADYLLTLGYGREIDSVLSIGANLKTVYSVMAGYTSAGTLADLAATYYNPELLFTFSAMIKNIGYQWKPYVDGNREPLPFEIQAGLSKRLGKAPIRFFLMYENLERWDLTYSDPANPEPEVDLLTGEKIEKSRFSRFGDKFMRHCIVGAEILPGKNFYIDIAYNYQRRKELKIDGRRTLTGFSFGTGIKISKFRIGYGRGSYHVAGAANHFSVTTSLSEFAAKTVKSN